MSKTFDLSEFFPSLEEIKVADIASKFSKNINHDLIENILANKLLYSATIPITKDDYKFDYNLIIQLIKIDKDRFYNPHLNKIQIPEDLQTWFPNHEQMTWAFIEALAPIGITNIMVKANNQNRQNLATYIRPTITANKGRIVVNLNSKKYELQVGSFLTIPASSTKVDIQLESDTATFLGKNQLYAEVLGGGFGIIIDARLGKYG